MTATTNQTELEASVKADLKSQARVFAKFHKTHRNIDREDARRCFDAGVEYARRAAPLPAEKPSNQVIESGNLVTIRARLRSAAQGAAPITLSGMAACALYYAMDTGKPMDKDAPIQSQQGEGSGDAS